MFETERPSILDNSFVARCKPRIRRGFALDVRRIVDERSAYLTPMYALNRNSLMILIATNFLTHTLMELVTFDRQ